MKNPNHILKICGGEIGKPNAASLSPQPQHIANGESFYTIDLSPFNFNGVLYIAIKDTNEDLCS